MSLQRRLRRSEQRGRRKSGESREGGPEEGRGHLCLLLLTGQEVSQTESKKSNRFGYMGVQR